METRKPVGSAAAAMLSAAIGLITLGLVHTGTVASRDFQSWVFSLGKLWIPGAAGIGPYSGKETLMLVAWFLSWAILYFALRKRSFSIVKIASVSMMLIGIATLFVWTPFIHLILGI
jgi:hypothetical protein